MLALGLDIAHVGLDARQSVGNRTRRVGGLLRRFSGGARAKPGTRCGGEPDAHGDRQTIPATNVPAESGIIHQFGTRNGCDTWAVDGGSRKGA